MSLFDIKKRMVSMAGAPKKPKTITMRLSVSQGLHAYLSILAKTTVLGASANDVAGTILTNAAKEMREANYHEVNRVPGDEQDED